MSDIPHDVLETYGSSHLLSLLVSNEHGYPPTEDGIKRLLRIAQQSDASVIVSTQWDSMARDNFGESGDTPNYFVVGDIDWEVSSSKQAYLIKNGYVPQQEYLDRGDGRLTKARRLDCSDSDYVDEKGTVWLPKNYVTVIRITDEVDVE